MDVLTVCSVQRAVYGIIPHNSQPFCRELEALVLTPSGKLPFCVGINRQRGPNVRCNSYVPACSWLHA